MITRHPYNDSVAWIDVDSPSTEEVRSLMEEYHINPHIAEAVLSPSLRSITRGSDNLLFVALHFPALHHTHTISSNQEVDFIFGEKVLITVRYDTVDALHKFEKIFEVKSILAHRDATPHIGDIFFAMLTRLYRSIGHELEYIQDRLEEAESNIFDGKEKEMVMALSNLSRDLLNIKQALIPHHEILKEVAKDTRERYGDRFEDEIRAIITEFSRIERLRQMNVDSLMELRATNDSLLTTKQNEVMKVLTIMAFVTFPLSLLAAVFGMNTEYIPLVGLPGDFWLIIGIMGSATLFMFAFFKHKKWL